jgi:hypothetical protein
MTVPKDESPDRKALSSWLKRHRTVLQWACVNAFESRNDPENIFLIQLKPYDPPTPRKHKTVKPQLLIDRTRIVNHAYLFDEYPGVVGLFAQQKQTEDIQGKVEGTLSYNMLVQYNAKWHLQRITFDEGEFDGLEKWKNWVDVLMSITEGLEEFKMVDGNPVKQ